MDMAGTELADQIVFAVLVAINALVALWVDAQRKRLGGNGSLLTSARPVMERSTPPSGGASQPRAPSHEDDDDRVTEETTPLLLKLLSRQQELADQQQRTNKAQHDTIAEMAKNWAQCQELVTKSVLELQASLHKSLTEYHTDVLEFRMMVAASGRPTSRRAASELGSLRQRGREQRDDEIRSRVKRGDDDDEISAWLVEEYGYDAAMIRQLLRRAKQTIDENKEETDDA